MTMEKQGRNLHKNQQIILGHKSKSRIKIKNCSDFQQLSTIIIFFKIYFHIISLSYKHSDFYTFILNFLCILYVYIYIYIKEPNNIGSSYGILTFQCHINIQRKTLVYWLLFGPSILYSVQLNINNC